ncbi:MAG: helix-turn-helix domain-containing protein [Clostridiales bacterium]|nr:helix-turn-helix domain-containing protein [Clostridiales bacterium]
MFGDNLKKYRIEKGYSQNDLAEKLFVTRQCVSKWEKGVTQPDLQTLSKISELLGVSADELIADCGGESQTKATDKSLFLFIMNIIVAAFCMIGFLIFWRFLPSTIPAHWAHGAIDRYGSRNEIFINLVTVAVFLAVDVIVFFAVRRVNDKRAVYICHLVLILLQIANFILIVALYDEYLSDDMSLTTCLVADIFACLSVAMHPKINKQNCFLGIRTAETLKSKTVWKKSNALACYLFSACSVVIFTVNMSVIFEYSYLCLLAYLVLAAIVVVYAKKVKS